MKSENLVIAVAALVGGYFLLGRTKSTKPINNRFPYLANRSADAVYPDKREIELCWSKNDKNLVELAKRFDDIARETERDHEGIIFTQKPASKYTKLIVVTPMNDNKLDSVVVFDALADDYDVNRLYKTLDNEIKFMIKWLNNSE